MNNLVLNYVYKYTNLFLNDFDASVAPVTEAIAKDLSIDRTLVSKKLNELFRMKKIIKINTRPVIYLAIKEFQMKNSKYASIDDFKKEYLSLSRKNVLESVIGWNGSLRTPIEQLKAALLYPDNGLPVIIFGESGTGKSYIVKKSFEYAQQIDLLENDAQLTIINCAQYANNPELLSSMLFGYVRGAFTGAVTDKKGAIETANNGILFLDEVHRLNPAGQEKLFTYMDNGTFSPIGNDSKKIQSKTRLMFATTESQNEFLETFLRRVPIKIQLPSLEDRSSYEKRSLINSFIEVESKRINKKIFVSNQCLDALYEFKYSANVGEVKNVIKNVVAKKYSENLNSTIIRIKYIDLPSKILNDEKNKTGLDKITDFKQKFTEFNPNFKIVAKEASGKTIYYKIQKTWNYISLMDERKILDRKKYYQIVSDMTRHILYTLSPQEREIITHISKDIRDILDIMHFDEFIFKNSSLYDMSLYIYYLMQADQYRNVEDGGVIISQRLSRLFGKEVSMINRLLPLFEGKFEIILSTNNVLWLAILISKADLSNVIDTPAVIMAHGYATASSMADTCNRILKSPVFYSIDMKTDITEDDMIEELKKLIDDLSPKKGLVLLIDMGSLNTIINKVKSYYSLPILIINNVSTLIALEVGNCLLSRKNFDEIGQAIQKTKVSCTQLNGNGVLSNVIITTCMTGMGTAKRIEAMLTNSFEGLINVKVMAFDFHELVNYKKVDLLSKINILAVVGVDDPGIPGIPYFGLEEIISGEKISKLKRTLSQVATREQLNNVETQLVKNFSLNRIIDSLTIISPEKVMPLIEKYIEKLKQDMNVDITNRIQIALYVHIASMIERVVRGNGIGVYNGDNHEIKHDKSFSVIKKDISVIEREFSIKINDPEIALIRDIIIGL